MLNKRLKKLKVVVLMIALSLFLTCKTVSASFTLNKKGHIVTALYIGHTAPALKGQVCPLLVYILIEGAQRKVLWLPDKVKRCNGTSSWDKASLYASLTGVSSGTSQRTAYILLLTVLCLLIDADLDNWLHIWDTTWVCGLIVAW